MECSTGLLDGSLPHRCDLSVKAKKRQGRALSVTGKQAQADVVKNMSARARLKRDEFGTIDPSQAEIAELKALEAVGVRRRRRWLNEKTLRDAAGPLSAADMQNLFHPAPFGSVRESPLSQIREDPAAAAVFESFRNIDPDKQTRVLERWEAYNQSLRTKPYDGESVSPAALALRKWSVVNRSARAALRKAKISSVLALESLILDYIIDSKHKQEKNETVIEPSDAFGRILVHGLAQFHGLASSSSGTIKPSVTLHFQEKSACTEVMFAQARVVTCGDILLAMAEVGELGLNQKSLEHYLSHSDVHTDCPESQSLSGSATELS